MVDLPAPFGPSSAVTPGPTRNDTSDTATTSPNHFEAPETSIGQTGAMPAAAAPEAGNGGRHRVTRIRW